jgi:hypothetical protein
MITFAVMKINETLPPYPRDALYPPQNTAIKANIG